MTPWIDSLVAHGALLEGETIVSFGDANAELVAARDHAVVCDLGALGVLRVAGTDAPAFLQGQLTNDVNALAPGTSQYSAWCSPKGRVLANFIVHRVDEHSFDLLLPAALAAPVGKRLGLFVLRSKVTIDDASATTVRLGVGGPNAATVVRDAVGALPVAHRFVATAAASVLALPGARFIAFAQPQAALALWQQLSVRARPAGLPVWQWLTIAAGIPVITAATADQFVPQAVNFDAIDGVSFKKGCYTGQEIVARTQYLGRLKERLVLAHVDGSAPLPGARLYSPVFDDQACGSVVNAAAAPGGGSDLLAVLQVAATQSGVVRMQAPDARPLALLQLPYSVPDAAPPRGRIA
jgi:tRNA-modifying protein YgfZ